MPCASSVTRYRGTGEGYGRGFAGAGGPKISGLGTPRRRRSSNRNDLKYIGATTRTLEYAQRRLIGRQDSYRDGPIFRATREFGTGSFTIRKLGSARSKRELLELKQGFIERFETRVPKGYNDRVIAQASPTPVVCVEKSIIYETVLQAADSASRDVDSVLQAIHTQSTLAGFHWKYLESPRGA
jgi:hypothetical protein